jgi:hypothetical protein
MKKARNLKIQIIFIVLICIMSGFSNVNAKKLEITFQLNQKDNFVPSNQLVIWLEKPDGSFVKSLFVSEYLSYGGYNLPEICSDWSTKSNWEEATSEEFDAVTSATPPIGNVNMKLKVPAKLVPSGKYILFIEVHLADEYNELYRGELILSKKKYQTDLKVSYKPERYPKNTSGDLLSDVRVIWK